MSMATVLVVYLPGMSDEEADRMLDVLARAAKSQFCHPECRPRKSRVIQRLRPHKDDAVHAGQPGRTRFCRPAVVLSRLC